MHRKQYNALLVCSVLCLSVLFSGCTFYHGHGPRYHSGYYPHYSGHNYSYHPSNYIYEYSSVYYPAHKYFVTRYGALTGATAGILIDDTNRWRGAVIGGSLGSILGSALTYEPYQYPDYYEPTYRTRLSHQMRRAPGQLTSHNYGTLVGGVTGVTAGDLIDDGNRWRGGVIGAFLGSFFGSTIYMINSGIEVPVLYP